jgi:hypothetical protein
MGSYGEAVSASAPRPRGSGAPKGKLEGVSLKILENGYTVVCRHAEPPRKGNQPYTYQEPPEYAFSDASAAVDFIAEKLGVKGKK